MLLCISQTITAAAGKLMAARGLGEGERGEKKGNGKPRRWPCLRQN